MKKQGFSAKQVAKWFVERAGKDVELGGEYLTQLKLQKLLYYAKGFFYVFENKPLFKDSIYSQKFGPVVKTVVEDLKPFAYEPIVKIFDSEEDISDPEVLKILEFVYEKVGKFSAKTLVSFTHQESPWAESKIGCQIKDEKILDFFKKEYLNSDVNKFDISRTEIIELTYNNILNNNIEAFRELAK